MRERSIKGGSRVLTLAVEWVVISFSNFWEYLTRNKFGRHGMLGFFNRLNLRDLCEIRADMVNRSLDIQGSEKL